ncbi:hypothetical protein Spica_1694 [Gracilinema caldarium DSM 7334]|uniref:Uncharacterized protein n=2 Tax=Gracilinema caldarium TaxID=215591 RepID=F8F1Z0_GRAC1|nr:hypothetical protein Spica_1694 [Gracilinema caldarium DSM 7334]
MIRGNTYKGYIILIVSLIFFAVGCLFCSRTKVFILSDELEMLLYGKNRALWQTIKASIRLYRPVQIIYVPQVADKTQCLNFLEKKIVSNSFIIAPVRYESVAAELKRKNPKMVIVIWGKDFSINYQIDAKRAAKIAGPLAMKTGKPPALFIPSTINDITVEGFVETCNESLREIGFLQGLSLITNITKNLTNYSSVILFPEELSLQNNTVPLILFSGIHKGLLPPSVIAVFDDTLWPHIKEIVTFYNKNIKKKLLSVLYMIKSAVN